VCYTRATPSRLSPAVEAEIERELLREKEIVEDPRLPISGYNYSALRDRLAKNNVNVSVNIIINRAKRLGCHKSRKKRKVHDRQVRTTSIGALIPAKALEGATTSTSLAAGTASLFAHDRQVHLGHQSSAAHHELPWLCRLAVKARIAEYAIGVLLSL